MRGHLADSYSSFLPDVRTGRKGPIGGRTPQTQSHNPPPPTPVPSISSLKLKLSQIRSIYIQMSIIYHTQNDYRVKYNNTLRIFAFFSHCQSIAWSSWRHVLPVIKPLINHHLHLCCTSRNSSAVYCSLNIHEFTLLIVANRLLHQPSVTGRRCIPSHQDCHNIVTCIQHTRRSWTATVVRS